jgi:hypothetical protein
LRVLICQIIAIFSGQGKTLQRFKVRVLKITRGSRTLSSSMLFCRRSFA